MPRMCISDLESRSCPRQEYPDKEEEITAAVVACGNSHSACITRRGMLYTFGLGNRGELGLGRNIAQEVGHSTAV